MYNYNSEIKLKIENDFFRKKVSTIKKKEIYIYIYSDRHCRNAELTSSIYTRSIKIKNKMKKV